VGLLSREQQAPRQNQKDTQQVSHLFLALLFAGCTRFGKEAPCQQLKHLPQQFSTVSMDVIV